MKCLPSVAIHKFVIFWVKFDISAVECRQYNDPGSAMTPGQWLLAVSLDLDPLWSMFGLEAGPPSAAELDWCKSVH